MPSTPLQVSADASVPPQSNFSYNSSTAPILNNLQASSQELQVETAPSNLQNSANSDISMSLIYKKVCKIEKNQEDLSNNQKIIMRDILILRKEVRANKNKPTQNK